MSLVEWTAGYLTLFVVMLTMLVATVPVNVWVGFSTQGREFQKQSQVLYHDVTDFLVRSSSWHRLSCVADQKLWSPWKLETNTHAHPEMLVY